MARLDEQKEAIRLRAESDLLAFIKLVHPGRVLGAVHEELISWWNRNDALRHQLVLLPRDHGKSAMVAYRVVWEITKNPAVRVLYISATSNLATKQLKFIKDILTSNIYRRYWPDMVAVDESAREKWTENEISVDHPKRKAESVRDPTVFTAGLTTTITGLHCDIAVLDDVVVKENAYTEEGRIKVSEQYSLLSSIEGTESQEWVVGTRYFANDLYNEMMEIKVDRYDKDGNFLGQDPLYEIFERAVEDQGDGTGQYIWPRQQRSDGKWFGFDQRILEEKRAKYLDKLQFRAQYYNDPHDPSSEAITNFQYYEKHFLRQHEGRWYYQKRRLNVFASIDFAFSLAKRSDFTSIVVVGVDSDRNYYVLDIARFKTDLISGYYQEILRLHQRWGFTKLRAEVTSAQKIIVKDIRDNYVKKYGLALSIEEFLPTRHIGNKEERVFSTLEPRYANGQIWHFKGGLCSILEEELRYKYPPHDDVKDALASVIDMAIPPGKTYGDALPVLGQQINFNARFGGIQ